MFTVCPKSGFPPFMGCVWVLADKNMGLVGKNMGLVWKNLGCPTIFSTRIATGSNKSASKWQNYYSVEFDGFSGYQLFVGKVADTNRLLDPEDMKMIETLIQILASKQCH